MSGTGALIHMEGDLWDPRAPLAEQMDTVSRPRRLAPVDTVVRLLAAHGYRVGEGLVRATVWVDASEERLKALRDEVAAWPCVSYFRIYAPTERVDLGLALL